MRGDQLLEPRGTVACVGGGQVGSAWAGLFAVHGYSVNVYDPQPSAEAVLREISGRASQLYQVPVEVVHERIRFTNHLDEALADACFVQESAPESLPLKRQLLADVDGLLPEHVVIASSTSDLPMSSMDVDCKYRERMLVGHPINPPYATGLVEVVGSPLTSDAAIDEACRFYRSTGRRPMHLAREVPGFLANRLQMALFREALQLIVRGEATVSQIDAALMFGLAPRIAAVGMFGGFVLNLRDHDPERWLNHIAAIGFGETLVHSAPLPPWTESSQTRLIEQWRDRIGDTDKLLQRRDRLAATISRLQNQIEDADALPDRRG